MRDNISKADIVVFATNSVPVPVPDLLYFNKVVRGTRVFSRGRIELTKVPDTGVEVVPSLPKCRVRVIQGGRTPGTRWLVCTLSYTPRNSCFLFVKYTCRWERLNCVLLKGQHDKIHNYDYNYGP